MYTLTSVQVLHYGIQESVQVAYIHAFPRILSTSKSYIILGKNAHTHTHTHTHVSVLTVFTWVSLLKITTNFSANSACVFFDWEWIAKPSNGCNNSFSVAAHGKWMGERDRDKETNKQTDRDEERERQRQRERERERAVKV